jgi:hypothetical protein
MRASRGHVGQELEHGLERIVVPRRRTTQQQEDLRVVLARAPPRARPRRGRAHGLDVVGRLAARPHRYRVRVDGLAAADPEERQRRRLADPGDGALDRERLRAVASAAARRFNIARRAR